MRQGELENQILKMACEDEYFSFRHAEFKMFKVYR